MNSLIEGTPIDMLSMWFEHAKICESVDPEAAVLSTVGLDGFPNLRVILIKSISADGLVFYTNTQSAKGLEIISCPKVGLLFHWKSLGRQIRIRGMVDQIPAADSDAYFASRPRGSQISAWASCQSQTLDNQDDLDSACAHYEHKFQCTQVPRPPYWSGFLIMPLSVEFWHAGIFRRHKRLLCERKSTSDAWEYRYLFP